MSAVTASRRGRSPFRRALGVGLALGVVAVYGAIVGILPLMDTRWVIVDVVSLGDASLIAIGLSAGAVVAAPRTSSRFWAARARERCLRAPSQAAFSRSSPWRCKTFRFAVSSSRSRPRC